MSGGFGSTSPASLPRFNPGGCSSKTSLSLLVEDSITLPETLPRSGLIVRGTFSPLPFVDTLARDSSWLPTPTAKANHCAPSMLKWPAYRRFQVLTGTGGRPHPEVFEWMMGLPTGWTACEPLATRSSLAWLRAHGWNSEGG